MNSLISKTISWWWKDLFWPLWDLPSTASTADQMPSKLVESPNRRKPKEDKGCLLGGFLFDVFFDGHLGKTRKNINLMWLKYHKPPMTGNGKHATHLWWFGGLFIIVLPTKKWHGVWKWLWYYENGYHGLSLTKWKRSWRACRWHDWPWTANCCAIFPSEPE